MKNNTIAIALGSLLLGGVATAGYLNNRDKTSDIQPPSDAAAAAATATRIHARRDAIMACAPAARAASRR